MQPLHAVRSATRASLLLLSLAALACTETDEQVEENVTVAIRNDGDGVGTVSYSYTTARGVENVECLLQPVDVDGCERSFFDAGLGGTISVTATPEAGSRFVGWTGCTSVTGTVCQLEFSSTPAFFIAAVTFELDGGSGIPDGANLLVNPSFETIDYRTGTTPVLPAAVGFWKGDAGAIVTGAQANGIGPADGSRFLRCTLSGPFEPSAQFSGCEVFQLVDVSQYATLIDAGSVLASARFRVNRVQLDAQTDRQFRVNLYALAGPPSSAPAAFSATDFLDSWQGELFTDGDVATWETVELVDRQLPAGTRTLVVRLLAGEDVFNDADATEFDGHYFDDASLALVQR